jgi:predicted DCC family thiol-disulfide oxidoreductase YuxK
VAELVFLYDGRCRLCTRGAAVMSRLSAPGRLELRDFQQPGALDAFPQVSYDRCMEAAQLVTHDGRAWSGLEAVVRALRTRRVLGLPAAMYYVPGLRALLDRLYGWVAANRYSIMGRVPDCDDAGCRVHFGPRAKP